MQIRLQIKVLSTGETFPLEVQNGSAVAKIKASIRLAKGIPVENQRLLMYPFKSFLSEEATFIQQQSTGQEHAIWLVVVDYCNQERSLRPSYFIQNSLDAKRFLMQRGCTYLKELVIEMNRLLGNSQRKHTISLENLCHQLNNSNINCTTGQPIYVNQFTCYFCEKIIYMAIYRCTNCNQQYCCKHRLPEVHLCFKGSGS